MSPAARRTRLTALAALVPAIMALLAGCASTVDGHGTPVSGVAAGSSEDFPSGGPSSPSSAPVTTAPVVTSTSASASPALASYDITSIRFVAPKGFVRSYIFHPVTPLEHITRSYYLVPSNERNGLDVMSITLYALPRGVRVDTVAAQEARVRLYNRKAHAQVQHGLHVDLVAGLPAIQENAVEPPDYRYAAWYVFGRRHFVLLSCQVDQQVDKMAHGCQSLLNSLHLG